MISITALLLAAVPALNDCNQNGIDDAVEIAKGITADCQGNGIPDECERGGVEPLAYWRFEEAGGELVEDLGPYGLDGTTVDTTVIGEIGYSIIPQTGATNLRGRNIAGEGSRLALLAALDMASRCPPTFTEPVSPLRALHVQ